MFTFQNNVPDYYMKESRDFQIFPRLNDILFMGLHQEVDTITELNNPKKCKNSYLNYLAEKIGFYTDEYIPDTVLANIISAFRTALKNKGTLTGIEQAIIAVLKAENSMDPPKIIYIKGSDQKLDYWEQYTINIYTPIKILNEVALREFLKYIIPAGHNFNIYTYENANTDGSVTEFNSYDAVNLITATNINIGTINTEAIKYTPQENNIQAIIDTSNVENRLLGTTDIGMVVDGKDIFIQNENGETTFIEPSIKVQTSTTQAES